MPNMIAFVTKKKEENPSLKLITTVTHHNFEWDELALRELRFCEPRAEFVEWLAMKERGQMKMVKIKVLFLGGGEIRVLGEILGLGLELGFPSLEISLFNG